MPVKPSDPFTDQPRRPGELRRLQLNQSRGGSAMWVWLLGIAAAVVVVTLLATPNRPNTPSGSSPVTTGAAPSSTPDLNPQPAVPSPASPATDNR